MKIINWICGKKKSKYTVEMFTDIAGAWRWRLRHQNGNALATSEAYSSKSECADTTEELCMASRFPMSIEIT